MNYGQLKAHFEDILNRSDITPALTTTFIDQGMTRIGRQLRTPMNEKVKRYALNQQTASLTLPSDFLEIISFYYGDREITRVPNAKFRQFTDNVHVGKPQYFTRQQEALFIYPQPASGDLNLYYYGDFGTLTDDSDETPLTIAAPDLITYAALTYAADHFLDERAEVFEAKFNQFLTEIQGQADDQELNGSTQAIAPAYHFED